MDYNLKTFSKFYYGIEILDGLNKVDFNDGISVKTATLTVGGYSLNGLAIELASKMNSVAQNSGFLVEVNRDFRTLTIKTADLSNFELLFVSGPSGLLNAWEALGFDELDYTGASEYSGLSPVCSVYYPQFMLKNFIDADLTRSPIEAVVNKSTSGNKFEVVRFGSSQVYSFEIVYTTNLQLEESDWIRNNPNGVDDLLDFMDFCTKKYPLEIMKDEADSNVFDTIILESTPQSQDGVSFEISPDYSQNLPEYYTLGGRVSFRRVSL